MTEHESLRKGDNRMGFHCPFCGSHTGNPSDYYSHLKHVILSRFIKLLRASINPDYQDAVLDCIFAVFGSAYMKARTELGCFGFLERFEQRYDEATQDQRKLLRLLCEECRKQFFTWELVFIADEANRTIHICEGCYAKREVKEPEESIDERSEAA